MKAISTLLSIIQALATVVLAIVAIVGLHSWKKQMKGQKGFELLVKMKTLLSQFKFQVESMRVSTIEVKLIKHIEYDKNNQYDRLMRDYDEKVRELRSIINQFLLAQEEYNALYIEEKLKIDENVRSLNEFAEDFYYRWHRYWDTVCGVCDYEDQIKSHELSNYENIISKDIYDTNLDEYSKRIKSFIQNLRLEINKQSKVFSK